MFFTRKKENAIIDFIANFSALNECATSTQMELLLAELDSKSLKIAQRFLSQKAAFSCRIPCSKSADDGCYCGDKGDQPHA